MTMADQGPDPENRPIPMLLWAILAVLVVALFVLLLGFLNPQPA